jgi:hypothetical protein
LLLGSFILVLDASDALRKDGSMARKEEAELWPRWSTWALVAVVLTSILTIAVTLNDIF